MPATRSCGPSPVPGGEGAQHVQERERPPRDHAQRQLDILSRAREGERNHTLNRCAFILGLFIRSGHLDENTARHALEQTALSIGLASWETIRTLDSALEAAR